MMRRIGSLSWAAGLVLGFQATILSAATAQECKESTFEGLWSETGVDLKGIGTIVVDPADAAAVKAWTVGDPARVCVTQRSDGDLYEITNEARHVSVRVLITAYLKNLSPNQDDPAP